MTEEAEFQEEGARRPGTLKGVVEALWAASQASLPQRMLTTKTLNVVAAAWVSISYQRDMDDLIVPSRGQ